MVFAQPVIDQAGGAADPGGDGDRRDRTVLLTGAALHAGVTQGDGGLLPLQDKDLVRTDLQTAAAADAESFLKLQGRYIL